METPLLHTPPVMFMAHLGEGHIIQGFDVAVVENALSHVRRQHLAIRRMSIRELEEASGMTVEASLDAMGQLIVLGHVDERELVEVVMHHGAGHIRTAADTADAADALMERLADVLREHGEREEDPRVPIYFWTLAEHGPEPMRRRLYAPRWEEIADNYVGPVGDALGKIMTSPPDSARGIALWRGEPGTGKTTALRALAREWRDHAELHVIIDPEVFLGDKASYLTQVLFGNEVDEYWDEHDSDHHYQHVAVHGAFPHAGAASSFTVGGERPRPRAKLIVLEDAGELISSDARVSAGQALSRLLNLTDGMLGQGANVSVLVTTNEAIDRLHPAIARPGRGWAHVEFRTFQTDDANAWLEHHGCDARVTKPASLAELYGHVRGDQVVSLDDLSD